MFTDSKSINVVAIVYILYQKQNIKDTLERTLYTFNKLICQLEKKSKNLAMLSNAMP